VLSIASTQMSVMSWAPLGDQAVFCAGLVVRQVPCRTLSAPASPKAQTTPRRGRSLAVYTTILLRNVANRCGCSCALICTPSQPFIAAVAAGRLLSAGGYGEQHFPDGNAGLHLVAERIVLPGVAGLAVPEAAPGYRVISPHLAIGPSVSVVIPARNEARNLPRVFASIPSWVDEIVLVDGHSVDDTVAVASLLRPDVKIITQEGHSKGHALLAGFRECHGEIIVMLSADGSTDGAEIASFVAALVGGADFAKGSRFSSGGGSNDITKLRRLGNWVLSRLVNRMFSTNYTDLCYGYNAFWVRHLLQFTIDCADFEVETQMNIRVARAGLRIQEIPSHEHRRVHGESNLNITRDGWGIIKLIFRERLSG
jgi:glycosyl transferase family 2